MKMRETWYAGPDDEGAPGGGEPPAPASVEFTPEDIEAFFSGNDFTPVSDDPPPPPPSDGPPAASPAGDGGGTPPEPPKGQQPAPSATPTPPVQQQPAGPTPEQQQLALLTSAVQRLLQQQPAPAPAPAAPAAPKPPKQLDFVIEDKVVADLGADDPEVRKKALAAYAQTVAQTVLAEVNQRASHLMTNDIPGLVLQTVQSERLQRQWHDDFYSTYPQLGKTQELKAITARAAIDCVRQFGMQDMTPDFKNKIASRALQLLNIQLPARRQPPPPPPPPPKVAGAPNGALDPNSSEGIKQMLKEMSF